MKNILPSNEGKLSMIHNMSVLVTCILVRNMAFFKLHFVDVIEYHIKQIHQTNEHEVRSSMLK